MVFWEGFGEGERFSESVSNCRVFFQSEHWTRELFFIVRIELAGLFSSQSTGPRATRASATYTT